MLPGPVSALAMDRIQSSIHQYPCHRASPVVLVELTKCSSLSTSGQLAMAPRWMPGRRNGEGGVAASRCGRRWREPQRGQLRTEGWICHSTWSASAGGDLKTPQTVYGELPVGSSRGAREAVGR